MIYKVPCAIIGWVLGLAVYGLIIGIFVGIADAAGYRIIPRGAGWIFAAIAMAEIGRQVLWACVKPYAAKHSLLQHLSCKPGTEDLRAVIATWSAGDLRNIYFYRGAFIRLLPDGGSPEALTKDNTWQPISTDRRDFATNAVPLG